MFQICNDLSQATAGHRCGVNEIDARELCGVTCTWSCNCAAGGNCWAVDEHV